MSENDRIDFGFITSVLSKCMGAFMFDSTDDRLPEATRKSRLENAKMCAQAREILRNKSEVKYEDA